MEGLVTTIGAVEVHAQRQEDGSLLVNLYHPAANKSVPFTLAKGGDLRDAQRWFATASSRLASEVVYGADVARTPKIVDELFERARGDD